MIRDTRRDPRYDVLFEPVAIGPVTAIGDALAPATIAHAVYAGRRYAEELDDPPDTGDEVPFRRELVELLPLF